MQIISPPSSDHMAAELDVREAISRLRGIIETLESALDSLARASAAAASPWPDEDTSVPAAGEPHDFVADGPSMPFPEEPSLLAEEPAAEWRGAFAGEPPAQESEPVRDAGWVTETPAPAWGAWSTSGAIRDGAWPSQQQVAPIGDSVSGLPPASPAAADDDAREQVRRAVQQLKAELVGDAAADAVVAAGPDELVSEPVAARQDEDASAEAVEDSPGDSADVRDRVRRAVLEARADLEYEPTDAATAPAVMSMPSPGSGKIPSFEALLDERFLAPASIVIEDPEGRVDLVRVYRALARLECAATANLANYSPHSVTAQLEGRRVPDEAEVGEAIRYAFERHCSVSVDGNRVTVVLADNESRVA